VNRQHIEEFVGEDAADQSSRQFIDPTDAVVLQLDFLARAHRGTALEDQIRKRAVPKNVPGEQTFAGAQFDNRE
jgi:hypothetical protein